MKKLYLIAFVLLLAACSFNSSEAWREAAEHALGHGEYQRAAEILEAALADDPNNQELLYYTGQAYRQLLFDDGAEVNNLDVRMAEKPTQYFRKAIEISPEYTGKMFSVGPHTKIQSIWSSVAMTYLSRGQADSALIAFKKGQEYGGFYPAILEINKNMMATCAENAILFTNGDNDTHPMWYLQFVEGYRKDITVINLPLLNVPWYLKMMKNENPFADAGMPLNLSADELESLTAVDWAEQEVILPAPDGKQISWNMKPTIQGQKIKTQDQVLLKVLQTNNWQRPIYFSITVAGPNKIGLDDYLSSEGMAFRLMPVQQKLSPDIIEKNLMQTYTYQGLTDPNLKNIYELNWMYYNYRVCFARLANHYQTGNEHPRAMTLIHQMQEIIPDTLVPYPTPQHKQLMDELIRRIAEGQTVMKEI